MKDLASIQKSGQREDYKKRVQSTLKEILTPEDAPACIRLALENAGTYDRTTMTGGLNGAIVLKYVSYMILVIKVLMSSTSF